MMVYGNRGLKGRVLFHPMAGLEAPRKGLSAFVRVCPSSNALTGANRA